MPQMARKVLRQWWNKIQGNFTEETALVCCCCPLHLFTSEEVTFLKSPINLNPHCLPFYKLGSISFVISLQCTCCPYFFPSWHASFRLLQSISVIQCHFKILARSERSPKGWDNKHLWGDLHWTKANAFWILLFKIMVLALLGKWRWFVSSVRSCLPKKQVYEYVEYISATRLRKHTVLHSRKRKEEKTLHLVCLLL